MKQDLTEQEVYFLAKVNEVNVEELLKVRLLLDPIRVRRKLIKYEYQRKKWSKLYKNQEIVQLLMAKYEVSRSYIESVIYDRPTSKNKQCVRCGKKVSTYRWNRNDGVCNECLMVNNIDYEQQERDTPEDEIQTRG